MEEPIHEKSSSTSCSSEILELTEQFDSPRIVIEPSGENSSLDLSVAEVVEQSGDIDNPGITEGQLEETSRLTVSVPEALKYVGEYGRYQCTLDIIFITIHNVIAMQLLIITFLAIPPTWKCNENSTVCTFNGTFSYDDKRNCDVPRTSWKYVEKNDFSIITQYDIHCGEEWLLILLSSIFFVGWGVGAIILGYVADNYGRKILIFPSFLVIIIIGSVSPFLPNIYLLVACRFIIGFFIHGTTAQGMILISEVVGEKQRTFATLIIFLANTFGWCLLPLQAYLLQNWKYLSMVCTLPYLLILPALTFVPESIKWLVIRGKTEEVTSILSTIAKWNRKTYPTNIIVISTEQTTCEKSHPRDLFQTRRLAIQNVAFGYIWMVTIMNYYGMFMAADQLGGSIYRDFALLSLMDVPGLFLAVYICNKIGEKLTVLISLLIGGILCVVVGIFPNEDGYAIYRLLFAIVGNTFINFAFNGVYAWSIEIYPTSIRSTGMGFGVVCSRIGTTIAPWIIKGLQPVGYWCPFLVLGMPAVIGFFIGFLVPKTSSIS